MSLPSIGEPAPDFTLPDQRGEARSLQDYRGRIVALYFYPKAMTPGCTVQACGIRDSQQALEDAGVTVLGVSPDPSPRLARFEDKQQLNFTLLSDEDHEVTKRYGAWGPKKFMGREFLGTKRMTFLIDREGVLRHIMEKVNTKTHHDDVLALAKQLA